MFLKDIMELVIPYFPKLQKCAGILWLCDTVSAAILEAFGWLPQLEDA